MLALVSVPAIAREQRRERHTLRKRACTRIKRRTAKRPDSTDNSPPGSPNDRRCRLCRFYVKKVMVMAVFLRRDGWPGPREAVDSF